MHFDYSKWRGPRPEDLEFLKQLMEIYRNLLLQTGGDADEALRWMEQFGEQYGFFNDAFGIADFKRMLERSGEVERTPKGFQMTPKGERRIRQDSLNEIFSALQAGGAGDHRTPAAGKGVNRQVFMITDGKPSAIREHGRLYKNPFGLDPKIVNKTLEEAAHCRKKRIAITTFMLAADAPLVEFVRRLTELNHGRLYETDPTNVGAYVFRDFVRNRRKRLN